MDYFSLGIAFVLGFLVSGILWAWAEWYEKYFTHRLRCGSCGRAGKW